MKRLIIHPQDRTTDFLKTIYDGLEDSVIYTERLTSRGVNQLFHHCPPTSQIMLLGHGSDKGLFYREDDTKPLFDYVMVGHTHRHFLQHRHNIIAIFCNADHFARAEGLHGLFTGMIISEMSEAEEYGIATTQEELERENVMFASRIRQLLDENCLLHDIPTRMRELNDTHSKLTNFNYQNIYYL